MKSVFDFDPTFPNSEFRVALIGSYCVGKTKVLLNMARALRVPTITESVRHVITSLGKNKIQDIEDKALMQWTILEWQIAHEKRYERFLSDRSTVDNAAYFIRYVGDEISQSEFDAYMDRARENAHQYTHLIYFPIMWNTIENDGFRDTDPEERRMIDVQVQSLLTNWGLWDKVYKVTRDDLRDGKDSRLKEILEHLQLFRLMREQGLMDAQV